MKKVRFGILAVFLCLGMLSAIPSVWASSYDPTAAPGGYQPAPPSTPMIVNQGGTGDALLAPFYNAAFNGTIGTQSYGNYVTYVQIENTTDKWVAAHVRMRTGRYSVEAVDFPILLSPYDVFWFQFEAVTNSSGKVTGVQIVSTDKETIINSGLDKLSNPTGTPSYQNGTLTLTLSNNLLKQFSKLKNYTYTYGGHDYDQESAIELTQGEIEVFGLFELNPVLPQNADGTLANGDNFYSIMSDLWNDTGHANPSYVYSTSGAYAVARTVGKALMGRVFIGDFSSGIYSGYNMTAIENWRTDMGYPNAGAWSRQVNGKYVAHRDWFIRGDTNAGGEQMYPGVILYQFTSGNSFNSDAAYENPDWATQFGPTWNDGDNWIGDPTSEVSSFSLDEVDDALMKWTLKGTYFNGGFGDSSDGTTVDNPHTFTLGVFSFPTKYLHYFYDSTSGLPKINNKYTAWKVNDDNFAIDERAVLDPYADNPTVSMMVSLSNQSEQFVPGTASPGYAGNFPWQVNLVPFGYESYSNITDFCFLETPSTTTPYNGLSVFNSPAFDGIKFFAGDWQLSGWSLFGSSVGYDPRTVDSDEGTAATGVDYTRSQYGLLGDVTQYSSAWYAIPPVGMMFDFETTNYAHARNYEPQFDNPSLDAASQAQTKLPYAATK